VEVQIYARRNKAVWVLMKLLVFFIRKTKLSLPCFLVHSRVHISRISYKFFVKLDELDGTPVQQLCLLSPLTLWNVT
jgi:hypothetical protein